MSVHNEQRDSAVLPDGSLAKRRRATAQQVRHARDRLTSTTGTRPAFDYELLRQFAQNRLSASLVIHRYGRLEPGDRIVLVATASPHRDAALAACHFLIDWLKTEAPFWKSEETPEGERWVEARAEDDAAKSRWSREG